jgi:hypothetical protein
MSSEIPFTQENLDFYLKELAKDYKKLSGKAIPAEIILIGGASVLANYGFRDMTYDIDAIITASSAIKDAINHVGDKFGLPNGWLNTDFVRTKSYTPKLIEVSVYYKTFSGILTVRTVAAEYLIAMKLKSGRRYKNDLSDIVGIVSEHRTTGKLLSYEQIDKAVCDLYDSWDGISTELKDFIISVLEQPADSSLYEQYRASETQSKDVLLEFERKYPNVTNEDNIDAILKKAKQKKMSKEEPEK